MSAEVVQGVFWALVAGVALLPLRVALILFVALAHVDPSGQAFASATSVGVGNLIKGVVLPALLVIRSGPALLRLQAWPLALKLWGILCVEAACGVAAGEYRVPALKMTAYLVAFLALFLVFSSAWKRRDLSPGIIAGFVWLGFGLGVLQTYALGNAYGGLEERFTSFSSPQSYAAFMLYTTIIVILTRKRWSLFSFATVAVGIVAIVLSGSRYVLGGLGAFLVLLLGTRAFLAPTLDLRLRRAVSGLVLIAGTAGAVLVAGYAFSVERITSFWAEDQRTSTGGEALGTLVWRLSVYEYALNELAHRDPVLLTVGTGTSSAGRIFTHVNPTVQDADVDANRIMHNEFLRAIYEWGVIGLLLIIGSLSSTFWFFYRRFIRYRSAYTLAVLCSFPGILFGLGIENVLSGAVMPNGVGVAVLLSLAWAAESGRLADMPRISAIPTLPPDPTIASA